MRGFYAKAGFVEVGHLKEVGWKFGKWWDVGFGQLSLRSSSSASRSILERVRYTKP